MPPMTHNIQMEEPRQTSSRVRAALAYPVYLHDVLLNTRGQRGGAFWYSQHAFKSWIGFENCAKVPKRADFSRFCDDLSWLPCHGCHLHIPLFLTVLLCVTCCVCRCFVSLPGLTIRTDYFFHCQKWFPSLLSECLSFIQRLNKKKKNELQQNQTSWIRCTDSKLLLSSGETKSGDNQTESF